MEVSGRPNKPSYYVVRDVWIDDGPRGKEVVFDVLGVLEDGSYWVTGVQVRIPRRDFDKMTKKQILDLIEAAVKENESKLDEAYLKEAEKAMLTESLKGDEKIKTILGSRIELK